MTTVLGPHSLSSHHASMASSCFLPFPATRSRYTNASSGIIPTSSSCSASTHDEALQQDAAISGKRFLLASSAAVSLAFSSISAQASPLHIPDTVSSHVSHYNAIGNIHSIAPARCLLADRSRGGGEEDTIFNDVSDAPPLNDSSGCANNRRSSESSSRPEIVTNESIIEEAWRIVNERFLDARHNTWSQDNWLKKKEEVLKRPVSTRMAAYSTIRSMLSALNDPYSRFITPLELKQLSKYDMTGVGLSLGDGGKDNSDFLRVVGVVLGSPAQVGGIKQGDELLSVNGVSIHGKSAFEVSSLIQGPKGTLVTITVRHNPCADIQTLSLERQQSVKTPVYYHLEHREDELVGYIKLKEFNAVAKRDLVTAMNRLTGAGAASILLDLRDNPGGLVQAGIEVAKVFLDEGNTVIYTVAKDPLVQKPVSVNSPPLTRLPVMVLVNEHTASASEIVAAALHDNCRAILVGRRTFGKGLIQSVFELSDGSGVILTVGKYVTPNHQDIDGNGISPDFRELPRWVDFKKQIEMCAAP